VTDDVWRRDEPDSPCLRICLIDPRVGLCIGCHRSADEIARWPEMNHSERVAILAVLANREIPVAKRSGGRTKRLENRRKTIRE